jgi:hypothetical protein
MLKKSDRIGQKIAYLIWMACFLFQTCAGTRNPFEGSQVVLLLEKNNMHFLDITLNGIETRLLIDTGASKSILDINQAEQYGFLYSPFSFKQFIGFGGLQDVYIPFQYEVKEFHIPFLGADLDGIQNFFVKDEIFIVGVLGSDFLERNKAVIDFKTNRLYLRAKRKL